MKEEKYTIIYKDINKKINTVDYITFSPEFAISGFKRDFSPDNEILKIIVGNKIVVKSKKLLKIGDEFVVEYGDYNNYTTFKITEIQNNEYTCKCHFDRIFNFEDGELFYLK